MTNMPKADIPDLLDKYRRQTLTEAEREALQRWLNEMATAVLDMDREAIRKKLEARRRK